MTILQRQLDRLLIEDWEENAEGSFDDWKKSFVDLDEHLMGLYRRFLFKEAVDKGVFDGIVLAQGDCLFTTDRVIRGSIEDGGRLRLPTDEELGRRIK
jgi:hypothetical protein